MTNSKSSENFRKQTNTNFTTKIIVGIILLICIYVIYTIFFTTPSDLNEMIENIHGGEAPF